VRADAKTTEHGSGLLLKVRLARDGQEFGLRGDGPDADPRPSVSGKNTTDGLQIFNGAWPELQQTFYRVIGENPARR
jgi:hypothetical protein